MQDLVNKITETLGGILPELNVSIKLGLIGGAIILVLFFIALGIGAGSKITKYRKQLLEGAKRLNAMPPITDGNVNVVYDEIKTHPDEVKKGWEAFMDQRVGYPSDYITQKDVMARREFSGKGPLAKVFLIILGAVVWALIGVVGFMSGVEADSIMSAIIALEFMIIPVAVYVITIMLLDIAFNRKIRRLGFTFMSFLEILDDKVVVEDKEEKEFVTEGLDEISRRVDELIAGKMASEDIIEVIAPPKAEEEEEEIVEVVEPEVVDVGETEEEPAAAEEPEEEPVVRLEDMTVEERENYFMLLLDVVDRAIADENCTDDDYALIASVIYDDAVKTGAIDNPDDMAIFEDCFAKLAEKLSA